MSNTDNQTANDFSLPVTQWTREMCYEFSQSKFLTIEKFRESKGIIPSPAHTEVTDKGEKCVAGCKNFTGYETKHHKDCPFYPESLSKKYDEMEAKLLQVTDTRVWEVLKELVELKEKKDFLDTIEQHHQDEEFEHNYDQYVIRKKAAWKLAKELLTLPVQSPTKDTPAFKATRIEDSIVVFSDAGFKDGDLVYAPLKKQDTQQSVFIYNSKVDYSSYYDGRFYPVINQFPATSDTPKGYTVEDMEKAFKRGYSLGHDGGCIEGTNGYYADPCWQTYKHQNKF